MKRNRKADMTPFTQALPRRQSLFLLPLMWGISRLLARRLVVDRSQMRGLKPPYIVLSMHQGFHDYYITPLSLFPHRATYVSDMEGFVTYGKRLYAAVGCIATRRYTNDIKLVKAIRHVLTRNKDILVLYPEARHSNIGTNSVLPPSIGKLLKLLAVPVVLQQLHGSALAQPAWDEHHVRRVPLQAALVPILSPDDLAALSPADITDVVNAHFAYDEFAWQFENQIAVSHPHRANGLHRALYRCAHCGAEGQMRGEGITLSCGACGKRWTMTVYGRLEAEDGGVTEFPHISDWYERQRACTEAEIAAGAYRLEASVRVEALPNAKGFVSLGEGNLTHTPEGFTLCIPYTGQTLRFPSAAMPSAHIEYDYQRQGDCLVLSTADCCYYLFGDLPVTKIMFAAEAFHKL